MRHIVTCGALARDGRRAGSVRRGPTRGTSVRIAVPHRLARCTVTSIDGIGQSRHMWSWCNHDHADVVWANMDTTRRDAARRTRLAGHARRLTA